MIILGLSQETGICKSCQTRFTVSKFTDLGFRKRFTNFGNRVPQSQHRWLLELMDLEATQVSSRGSIS